MSQGMWYVGQVEERIGVSDLLLGNPICYACCVCA
jgi:hypothetical protein